jgi:hypothetical protein
MGKPVREEGSILRAGKKLQKMFHSEAVKLWPVDHLCTSIKKKFIGSQPVLLG